MDKGVRVEKTHERGRHLVARRSFEPGDVVVSQWPYAAVLFNAEISRFCNYCFRSATNLRRCSRSKFASYCSRECQLRDWKEGYRNECDFLVQSAPRIPPASVRLAAHVAWKYKKELEHSLEKTDMWNSYLGVESLVDHWDHLPDAKLKAFAEMGFFITKCETLCWSAMRTDCPCVASVRIFLKKVCPSMNLSPSLLHDCWPSLHSIITPSAVLAPPIWAAVSILCWQWPTIPHGQTAFSVSMENSANLGQCIADEALEETNVRYGSGQFVRSEQEKRLRLRTWT